MCIETKVVVEPPKLLPLRGCCRVGSESQLFICVISVMLLGLLRMWLEAEVAVVDFGLRRKGLCETFGLWNLHF
ncbi:uncharacterized protein DS421_3g84210 [Arachis hypogaea]|nr:uncharacterized protein DS421_3g84210 [Arachis hypogaea]